MNVWEDTAVVLSRRAHGENGLIVSLLTAGNGRHMGYVPGGQSRAQRAGIEPGAIVKATWQSRVLDQMGTYRIEPERQGAAALMDDALKLAGLLSACSLCDAALPERESHPGLYAGMLALMAGLQGEMWGPAYILWEIAFMKELGFALDLSRCAAGGDATDLTYVSPKSGVAVSREHGLIYKSKLLPLPEFLKKSADPELLGSLEDTLCGLRLTAYFLEHWVFVHHRIGFPEARVQLMDRVARAAAAPARVAV